MFFTRLVSLASVALAVHAATVSTCDSPTQVSHKTFNVAGKTLVLTTSSCANSDVTRRQDTNSTGSEAACITQDVSGAACFSTCNNIAGILPPISEDCDQITDAIEIMVNQGGLDPTFTVAPNHVQTLSFGTCSYFFQNVFSSCPVQSTWADLSTDASSAAEACFPPHQPFSPEGLCTAINGVWAVGASHS